VGCQKDTYQECDDAGHGGEVAHEHGVAGCVCVCVCVCVYACMGVCVYGCIIHGSGKVGRSNGGEKAAYTPGMTYATLTLHTLYTHSKH
jgi:hypothetical protein